MYQSKIAACDRQIEQCLAQFEDKGGPSGPASLSQRRRKPRRSEVKFDARTPLYRATAVDLTAIDGIAANTALTVLSEIGTDMSLWPTEKHFCSWLGLAPGNKVSGGKRLSGRTKPSQNRAAAALRMAAQTLTRSRSALGAYCRRLAARIGAPKAITATARKLACRVYHMLKFGTEYVDEGQDYYEQRYRERVLHTLRRRAFELGFQLIPTAASDPA